MQAVSEIHADMHPLRSACQSSGAHIQLGVQLRSCSVNRCTLPLQLDSQLLVCGTLLLTPLPRDALYSVKRLNDDCAGACAV
jgi:hypothetical protein